MPLLRLLLVCCVAALPGAAGAATAEDFTRGEQPVGDGTAIPYRLLAPPAAATGAQPLLVLLHGAGERGDDNEKHLKHFRPFWGDDAVRARFPCWILAPQAPRSQLWATYGWGTRTDTMAEQPSPALAAVIALLAALPQQHAIDPRRIYVIGLSMGGYGTWELVQRLPQRIAAAVPICGGGDPALAARIATAPIWAFHGDRDNVIAPDRTRRMIEALIAAGGKPRSTEYAGVGHGSWGRAFAEPDLLPWLFAQRLQP